MVCGIKSVQLRRDDILAAAPIAIAAPRLMRGMRHLVLLARPVRGAATYAASPTVAGRAIAVPVTAAAERPPTHGHPVRRPVSV